MKRLLAILNALIWVAVLVTLGYCFVMTWLHLPWYAALLLTFGLIYAHDHDNNSVLKSWLMLPWGFIGFIVGALGALWSKIFKARRV